MSWKQISGAQQMMRIAINGQQNVDSLIGYYRDTIDDFNLQRAQWAIHYQNCKNNASDDYLLDQQIKSINDKTHQLQDKLAYIKAKLTNQRQKYFQTVKDGQKLKNNLEISKKELMQVTNELKPVHLQNQKINSTKNIKSKTQKNPQALEIELELINMNKDHQAKRQTLLRQIDILKKQLSQLTDQHQQRDNQCKQEYIIALNKLANLQKKHMDLTIQFFRFRMDGVQEQQKFQQQNQIIRLKNVTLLQKLKKLQESHNKQFDAVDSQVKRKNQQFKKKYDQQLKRKQDHLTLVKQQYQRVQDMHLTKIKQLEEQLRATNTRLKTIQQKGKYEVSSLRSQIKILKARIGKQEVHKMQSQLAEHKDQQQQQQQEQQEQDYSQQSLDDVQLQRIDKQVKDLQKKFKLK